MCKIFCLIAFVLLIGASARAQEADEKRSEERIVEILNADSARATNVDGDPADILIGHVAIKQGDTFVNADRAVRFKTKDQIIFEGDVTIVDEGDSLRADRVVYESDVKTGLGTGNVRWSDGEVAITSSLAHYSVDDKIAEFEKDVVMQDSTTTVLSLYGTYDVDSRIASFRDDVYLEQRRLALTADALTHERESGLTTATGKVWIFRMSDANSDDDDARVLLAADTASSERDSGINRLTGRAGLVRIDPDSTDSDTLVVRSSSVVVEFTDSTEAFDARENVRFWRKRLSGQADSLRYTSVSDATSGRSSIRMIGDPFVWSPHAQVNGDTVDVHTENGAVRNLEAYENAYVGFQDSTHDFIQQLRGRRLEAFFRNDSLTSLTVRPNAEALYFAVDSSSTEDLSALRFTSMQITLRFAQGDIERIVASEGVEGDVQELEEDTPRPTLKGFRWLLEERPRREDLLDANLMAALKRFQSF